MLDLGQVRAAFPEFTNIDPLRVTSGQKDVLKAQCSSGPVALKLIKPTAGDHARMAREIEAVARLKSAYVPELIDHGSRAINGHTRLYVVERFVEGESYRTRLDANPRPPASASLWLAKTLLSACQDFEDAILVHRDIKPDNIMLDASNKVWVIDFGIVRILDQASLTPSGQHFGPCTPGYGAPEQLRNLKSEIDIRADLYSVGIVLYEALNGSNPHLVGKHDVLEVIRSMESQDLPRLAGVDPELCDFIAALTSRYKSRRPRSASEAIDWFDPIHARLTATP